MKILGISSFYHDSAAALIESGQILAAAQEERFTRKKHDDSFPANAIDYCLKTAGIGAADIDAVVFYDKPFLSFERILETHMSYAPKGFKAFSKAMPIWLGKKLNVRSEIKRHFKKVWGLQREELPKIYFTYHHQSHAASAFFPSAFKEAAVLCMDGVGEWATTSAWWGHENKLKPLWQIDFPHSIGLLYSAFTYYLGFKVNSGEYKLMGLAPYGEPKYVDLIREQLIDVKEDGSFRLQMEYFDFPVGLKMTNKKFDQLFGGHQRQPEAALEQVHMDLARSIQEVTEEVVEKLARSLKKETGAKNLCMAGGVALNCVANGRLLKKKIFDNIWVQPAAGDAGGALGAALSYWYEYQDQPRKVEASDQMAGGYLGPDFSDEEVEESLNHLGADFEKLDEKELLQKTANVISNGKVVGWFQGRMEYGPRALGGRSFLGDARQVDMQKKMNLKIKFRESFRPFAPAVLREKATEFFEMDEASPYMLMVSSLRKERRRPQTSKLGLARLSDPLSDVPAITHVDYSARVQTVDRDQSPKFHSLLSEFERQTGTSLVVNTSFNVRGEPIVCNPQDAYSCFMKTDADYLVVGNYFLDKAQQTTQSQYSKEDLPELD